MEQTGFCYYRTRTERDCDADLYTVLSMKKVIPHDTGKKTVSYYVYLLLCDDGSYYTGYTSDLTSRLERHTKGHGARYTQMRKPKTLVYFEEFRTRRAAMRRERQIKALTHNEKFELAKDGRR